MGDGTVVIGAELNTESFDAQIDYLERKLQDLEEDYDRHKNYKWFKEDSNTAIQLRNEIEKVSNQLIKLYDKKNLVSQDGFNNMVSSTNATNLNLSKMIKKVARLGLAFLGIRGAFTFVRQAISSVLSNNEKLKKQYDGLKQSLYGAFAPVVEKIINLMRTLMAYANYIWKRLFGKDLFANSVKSSSKTAKNVKEISKQLASFDEANVLSDNKSGGTDSSGATDIGLAGVKIPDWLVRLMDWVEKHPKLSKIIFGLAAFTLFGGWKMASGLVSGIGGLIGHLGTLAALAATAYIIYLDYTQVKEAVDEYIDLLYYQSEVAGQSGDLAVANAKTAKSFVDTARKTGVTSEQLMNYRMHIKETIKANNKKAESDKLTAGEAAALAQENEVLLHSYQVLYEEGLLPNEEEERKYYEFLKDIFPMGIVATDDKMKELKNTFDKLDKQYNTQYQVEISETGTKKVQNSLDKLGESFDNLFKKWNTSSLGKAVNKVASALKIDVGSAYHANGGIVNLPGRGVPINHIAGEAGREGIVPIDNESQMALLGSEIAKRVVINLTNVTEMNGRTISRELNRINSDSSFLTNS